MPDSSVDLVDLVDLKMLPAWVKEPAAPADRYAHHEGESDGERRRPGRDRRSSDRRGPDRKRPAPKTFASRAPNERQSGSDQRATSKEEKPNRKHERGGRIARPQDRHREDRQKVAAPVAPPIAVKFLPQPPAFENVVAQIKSDALTYSLFALARLFLEKPTRYDVRLTAPADSPLLQLGEDGALSVDRQFLEHGAFRFAQSDFYKTDITETEPIKGNFTNVARCKLSSTVLGPTNHHDYQKRLRQLYEQRFSRRMSFTDYQRSIEIVSDPQLVEKWKDEARKITTFTTLREETPATFSSATEAERHFRQTYLPNLIRTVSELTIGGVASRQLADRVLNRLVEDAWSAQNRSPSLMMQELAAQFRQAALHVFRHRRGMLFVSPIRVRPFVQDGAAISPLVKTILDNLSSAPRIGRKELAEKLIVDLTGEEQERAKLALASDLRWLISEGYVIEFNDGSLDLPRVKAKAEAKKTVVAAVSAAEELPKQNPKEEVVAASASTTSPDEAEIGGS
ncbi:MAG TPA: hypothetical protein VGQ95_00460 [Chthoniobacterales bacterium]|nr:hypothetical protein [Chthoniobacterales bacterium]